MKKTHTILAALGLATIAAGLTAKRLTVQDFEGLEASGMGTYADEGKAASTVELALVDEGKGKAVSAGFEHKLKGWCGMWVRAGADWKGQDWRGAKSFSLRVKSSEPVALDLAFNDANQNAYIARLPRTKGKGWETLTIAFSEFVLNPQYQPPQAKLDAPLDLSHIEAFNVAFFSLGKHSLVLDDLSLQN